jgi:hypothetical protein
MRISIGVSVALASLLLSTAATRSQTLTALTGKPVRLTFLTDSINPDCTTEGPSTIRVTQPPQHGSVRIARTRGFPTFRPANLRSACNTRRVSGLTAHYVSQRGYLGTDTLSLEFISSRGGMTQRSFSINVR